MKILDYLLPILIPYLLVPFDEVAYCSCRLVNRQCSLLVRQLCREAVILTELPSSRSILFLPPNLQTLRLALPAKSFLDVQLLPSSLEHFYVGNYYRQPLIFRHLPSSLRTLVCGEKIKCDFRASELPRTLEILSFENRKITADPEWQGLPLLHTLKVFTCFLPSQIADLPSSLTSLTVRKLPSLRGLPTGLLHLVCEKVDSLIDLAQLPRKLKSLRFSSGWRPFSFVSLPPELEDFYSWCSNCSKNTYREKSPVVLPSTLKKMVFGRVNGHQKVIYPPSLRSFTCFAFLTMEIPPNLEELTIIGNDDNRDTNPNCEKVENYLSTGALPLDDKDLSTFQEEYLLNHHFSRLPRSLTSLDVDAHSISVDSWPPSLTFLRLHMASNCPFPRNLPATLRHLEFWGKKEEVDLLELPRNLEYLEYRHLLKNLHLLADHLPKLKKISVKGTISATNLPRTLRSLAVTSLQINYGWELPRQLRTLSYSSEEPPSGKIIHSLPRTLKCFSNNEIQNSYNFASTMPLMELCSEKGRDGLRIKEEKTGRKWSHDYNLASRTRRWKHFLSRLQAIRPSIKKSNLYLCWMQESALKYATSDVIEKEIEIVREYYSLLHPYRDLPDNFFEVQRDVVRTRPVSPFASNLSTTSSLEINCSDFVPREKEDHHLQRVQGYLRKKKSGDVGKRREQCSRRVKIEQLLGDY